jgi:hypothetical protein
MDVLIRLERTEPPTGTVLPPRHATSTGADPVAFVGWLGLLQALSEVVRSATDPAVKGE